MAVGTVGRARVAVAILACATCAACASDERATTDAGSVEDASPAGDAASDARLDDGGPRAPSTLGPPERPASLVAPREHDGVTPLPLLVLLHGYGASAALQDLYLGTSRVARELGFYLLLPDGMVDAGGNRFWNATDFCCDFGGEAPDDVAYLAALVDEAKRTLPIDAGRVYFFGHSNGGFMSYRMACEHASEVTAIAALAGTDYVDEMRCVPSEGVSVLHVHGTADDTILYEGSALYSSARATIERWAARASCDPSMPTPGARLDLDLEVEGDDTSVERFETGCAPGLDAELWTIEGGAHLPVPSDAFTVGIARWLLAHEK